jgi:hypothetical protein
MSGSLGDVVRQLRQVIVELDQAAVTAKHAQAGAEQAHGLYSEAARGTDHPQTNRAINESRTAAEKAGKSARLLAEAASAFTEYVNHIAPGSAPPRSSAPEASPAGERLMSPAGGHRQLSNKLLGRIASVKNADDGLQNVEKVAETIQEAAGSGGVAVQRSAEPAIRAAEAPRATAGDALLAAFTVAIMGIKGAEVAARLRDKAKTKKRREDQEGNNDG